MTSDAQNNPFMRNLASSDKKLRDNAFSSLRAYLSSQSSIPHLDLLKLWKGLFYCLWMQDKPALQQKLSRDLAGLAGVLNDAVVLDWFRAFFETMSREWGSMEALRVDKYLYLVRQYMNAGFAWLAKKNWKKDVVKEWNQVMSEGPLETQDMKIPNGLRYHVMDVWVDEMEKNGGEEWAAEKRRKTLDKLVEPIELMQKEGKLKPLREAAKECLTDERLRRWRGIEDEPEVEMDDDDEEVEWGGFAD